MKDNNPPAFPMVSEQYGHYCGMDLLDYFAAHAPEIPDWFEFAFARDYDFGKPPEVPDMPCLDQKQRDTVRWMANEGYGESDVDDSLRDLWPHVATYKAYFKARDKHQHASKVRRFVAWRWFYAESMLAARAPAHPQPGAPDHE